MRRTFLIALGAGLVVIVVALLAVGLFPPRPLTHTVEKQLPSSTLSPH